MSHPYENVDNPPGQVYPEDVDPNIAVAPSAASSVAGSTRDAKTLSTERQIKFERAQKCLENAALVSKRIKEHRKATAELLGRPFEDDDTDTVSDIASTMSERTGFSAATDISTTLSVQDALNIPGISESLANTLKQKEILMERIKQYKEISKRPSIMKSSPISRRESVSDPKTLTAKMLDNNEKVQFQNIIRDKDNTLSIMQVKMKAMETTIMDLHEKISEKDQIIAAKTKATSLMSDSLGQKEKDSTALLDDTRQQMTKMQENFIVMETEWKNEKDRLCKEISEKDEKIYSLQEANTILENSRFEISVAHSKLTQELELKINKITELEEKLLELSSQIIPKSIDDVEPEQEKGSLEISNMSELTKKVELLEQLNCQIRQTNKELEIRLASVSSNPEPKSPSTSSPSKKASPLPTRRGGRNTAAKSKSPWTNLSSETSLQGGDKKQAKVEDVKLDTVVQSLNKDILDLEYTISQKDILLSELKETVSEKEALIERLSQQKPAEIPPLNETFDAMTNTDESKVHSTVSRDVEGTLDAALVNELEDTLKAAQEQIATLNEEIATANKNMIKVKANHKLKLKQMQKTIDNLSRVSDANAEIVKLNEELHQLHQRTAELEEEKGSLQLHLVDYDGGRLTESDVYKKLMEMENLAESRLNAITVLETQKFDLVQELHDLQQKNEELEDKVADMSQVQNEQVSSEMKSIQLEEQIDSLLASKQELELIVNNLKLDSEQLQNTMEHLKKEKDEITHKLDHYIQENIELTDKLEKMSADKASSAESIEIVDPLTTQEKLELEEYNKGMGENESKEQPSSQFIESSLHERADIENLVSESAELNKKIELFTQERQEVMEKLNIISIENEQLSKQILQLTSSNSELETKINVILKEKNGIQALNDELNRQIEEIKRERIEIVKEGVETYKPISIDEPSGAGGPQDVQPDEKATDKNKAKMVKQLTKDILKLKNVMKEREDELADCQMKILSLEEQQQKQAETIAANAVSEAKLLEENASLKNALSNLQKDKDFEIQITQLTQNNEQLHYELQKLRQEYCSVIEVRDSRIQELENLLRDYENQIYNYNGTLQHKDKEITEYLNQITKLNEVSQKLRSTVEILEEEKSNDPNAEMVKSLNKQMALLQNKLVENEEKLRFIEDEKTQLISLKTLLENQSQTLEEEINNMKENLTEKQTLVNKLQNQQDKHAEEMSAIKNESKERDEEIHEIKLQLRKESIENEKLRNDLTEKEKAVEAYLQELTDIKDSLNKVTSEKESSSDQYTALETKNKELMDKLKKYAATLKKKTAMYNEMDAEFNKLHKELEVKNSEIEQFNLQRESLLSLQEKLKCAEEELNRFHVQRLELEQRCQNQIKVYEQKLFNTEQEFAKLSESFNAVNIEFNSCRQENANLTNQIDYMNKKLAAYEIELKNSTNYLTKISSLENDIGQKDAYITQLLDKISTQDQLLQQHQFGLDAKVQERELYIENLQTEIEQYKNRISRLENSVSAMEDMRRSLERKADHLDTQLHEKQQAYDSYTSQEDELVNRLAGLMHHDRVIEKQLQEIERENHENQQKLHNLQEENQKFRTIISDLQQECATLEDKAGRCDRAESQEISYQDKIRELENHLKKIATEHQNIIEHNKKDIEELEAEFNTQIEEAIKEKKVLSEKYERLNEVSKQLEQKLYEYSSNVNNLNHSLEDMSRRNAELNDKINSQKIETPDYTEQYISEINKLNAAINAKNQEIIDISDRSKNNQQDLQAQLNNASAKLKKSSAEIDRLITENNSLRANTENIMTKLTQRESQLNQLVEQKKHISFEMNIPKTEGLLISSTIEEVNAGGTREPDLSSIEAQMVAEIPGVRAVPAGADTPDRPHGSQDTIEPVIVPKKAYLCYTKQAQDSTVEPDPFNSDEGWGLGEEEIAAEASHVHFNEQLNLLKAENEKLQKDLSASSTKLLKAMKKLKELKSTNEMLSKEISLSKQMSQVSFLDTAIEDELKSHIMSLEKRVEELNNDLIKEKRDRDSMRKQNEVFQNANDKFMEIKEKLDNEVELWKYKFREANNKLDTLQWGGESKTPEHKPHSNQGDHNRLKEDMIKLEKENDELQNIIDDLTARNKELTSEVDKLKIQINNINVEMQQSTSYSQEVEKLTIELEVFQNMNKELTSAKELLETELARAKSESSEMMNSFEILNVEYNHARKHVEDYNDIVQKCQQLEQDSNTFKQKFEEAQEAISTLNAQLNEHKAKILETEQHEQLTKAQPSDDFIAGEQASHLANQLQEMSAQLVQLQSENNEAVKQSEDYQIQIKELRQKIAILNTENDQLLSNVAETRSAMSAAVDQRGYEIAELWKQHLAQRETEFQSTEQDLRSQLAASDAKYEQLLDSVQSSSQEETNALVMLEQIGSLQSKLQDKEEHLISLQSKFAEVVGQLDQLRAEFEDEKVMYENKLLAQQDDCERQMQELAEKERDKNAKLERAIAELRTEVEANRNAAEELRKELDEAHSLRIEVEQRVIDLTHALHLKDAEIQQKVHEFSIALSQRSEELDGARTRLAEYEKRVEDVNFEKESELAVLRLTMHEAKQHHDNETAELQTQNADLINELEVKIQHCSDLTRQLTELNKSLDENATKFGEMEAVLESQEYDIVTLRDENESLRQLLDRKKVSFAEGTKAAPHDEGDPDGSLEAVPRAELDLALYMLHQRDVRCEELTVELTQLLEERDTLQLRLSDSIRTLEELRARCRSVGAEASHRPEPGDPPSPGGDRQPEVQVHGHPARTSFSEEDERPKLQAKLSELRTVRQSRDVRLRRDSAARQLDLRRMRRDVAALPPEAVARLEHAHHTLSRDSQSTSTVLLNWLRGKGTPKVIQDM